MKTLIAGLLILGSTLASAGTIENRSTAKLIKLEIDSSRSLVKIDINGRQQQIISYSSLSADEHNIELYRGTRNFCDNSLGRNFLDPQFFTEGKRIAFCLLFPGLNVPVLALATGETLILPFKLIGNSIKARRSEKDLNVLISAILQEKDIVVSNKRFNRIIKLLNH